MSKRLVTYFSASGITAKVAENLADAIGADIFEIQPEVPYTKADLNWMDKKSRSTIEMSDPTSRPAIVAKRDNMDEFMQAIPLFHPHIFIANVASIPLWIKTNLRRVAQRQSTVGLNSPSIFICCSFLWVKTELPKATYI